MGDFTKFYHEISIASFHDIRYKIPCLCKVFSSLGQRDWGLSMHVIGREAKKFCF